MSMNDFDIVEFLEESIASDEQYLVRLQERLETVASRYQITNNKQLWVVRSNMTSSFAGNVDGDSYALRFDATDCRVFVSKREAYNLSKSFQESDIDAQIVDYRDAIEAEIKKTQSSIPETKKALLKAMEMAA
jgi:hypothetical protein